MVRRGEKIQSMEKRSGGFCSTPVDMDVLFSWKTQVDMCRRPLLDICDEIVSRGNFFFFLFTALKPKPRFFFVLPDNCRISDSESLCVWMDSQSQALSGGALLAPPKRQRKAAKVLDRGLQHTRPDQSVTDPATYRATAKIRRALLLPDGTTAGRHDRSTIVSIFIEHVNAIHSSSV